MQIRKRGRKIDVPAGQSISLQDLRMAGPSSARADIADNLPPPPQKNGYLPELM